MRVMRSTVKRDARYALYCEERRVMRLTVKGKLTTSTVKRWARYALYCEKRGALCA
jgi:hypothetical protein